MVIEVPRGLSSVRKPVEKKNLSKTDNEGNSEYDQKQKRLLK